MRKSATLTGALCAALLVAGCGAAATTATTTGTAPRSTTTATPVSHHQGLTAEQITAAMQRAGFRIAGKVTAYTAATDPDHLLGRQGGYTSKTEWSLPDGSFDSVEVYPDTAGATKRVAYLSLFSGGILGDGYDYQSGPVILRLSKALTPAQAAHAHSIFVSAAGAQT